MPATLPGADAAAVNLARECVYRFLAAALSDPRGRRFPLVLDTVAQDLACESVALLRDEASFTTGRLGFGEFPVETLKLDHVRTHLQGSLDLVQADYDRVFGLAAARECPPYETEYHPNSDPFFRSQQMADIAGFYRAFGLEPGQDAPERLDHAALELEFMAFLLMKQRLALTGADQDPAAAEHAAVCDAAQRNFFRDHLAWWLPSFATGLRRRSGDGFYAALGRTLAALIPAERYRLGVDTPSMPARPNPPGEQEEPGECAGCAAHP